MLESLLYPKTVAVIGASRTPGKVGHEIVANLVRAGFKGEIVPINPSGEDVLGLKCYPDLKTYGRTIDLGIVSVPTKLVRAAVESSINANAKAITVITAGFKEIGPEGAALEREIAALCRSNGVRMLGPNCLGLINTENAMNASFAKQMPKPGGISVVSQSGALCTAILDWAAAEDVGLAKLISMGNKADLNETDFLAELARDPQTKVIACYLENITQGDEFLKAAEAAANLKPIVALKVGTSNAGVKAASSHTGSLAGADIAYGAAFKRAGVMRAYNFEALFDLAMAFAMQPMPKGDRVAIITNAGGPGIIAADAAEHSGLKVEAPSPAIATMLKAKLPSAASVGNPIDVLGDASPERYAEAVRAVMEDDSFDALCVILTPQAMTDAVGTARAIAEAAGEKKPMVTSFMGGHDVMEARRTLKQLGIPDYPAPHRAVYALRALCDYALWQNRPPRIVTRFPVNRRRVERVIARHMKTGRPEIGEVEAKEILQAYDFDVPPGRLAASADEAVAVAEHVGYPVAMKISSPDILHKSDMGGVKLSLSNADQVRDAYDLMMLRIGRRMPEARLDGVYIEQMAPRGREVIIGMTRDPEFGPMLMFGLGGIFVEVMKDVTFYLAPITAEEAMQMLVGTRSYALLKGARGEAGVDITAIANGLQRISQLVTDFPQIKELDINPFLVGPAGTAAVVADARMILSGVQKRNE
ncbi:MAG TPA: acetate--CoA ligase family protein [Candidatus Hydrogenedentes bacterium]|nr:acetate--CoA ligase family protein [Candidatus Hydrogenedentota bacterium]